MEKKATNRKLKEAFREHLSDTEAELERLEVIGGMLEVKLTGKTCKAMQGLVEEGKEVIEEECDNQALLDTLLIGAARRVEHYEMAAYDTARAMATQLGLDEVAGLLGESFDEEVRADEALSSILNGGILMEANLDSEMDEEDADPNVIPMKKRHTPKKPPHIARVFGVVGCVLGAYYVDSTALADNRTDRVQNEAQAQQYESDNTGRNARDKNDTRVTADDQSLSGPDLEVLARIRREIAANGALSTNGQNVKIVVQNGEVILRGPVKSAEEKAWIQQATARLSSGYSVINQLEVAPPKKG